MIYQFIKYPYSYPVTAKILSKCFPSVLWMKDKKSPDIYLTFDDGPHAEFTPLILDILNEFKIKATFFLSGEKCIKNQLLVKRIHREAHKIGLHSFHHHKLIFRSTKEIGNEIQLNQKVIAEITGIQPDIFRPPYGYFTPRLLKICQQQKIRLILWSHMPYEFILKRNKNTIIKKMTTNLCNGSIIVMHDGHTSGYRTVDMLPQIISNIKKLNKSFKTL